MGSFSLLQGSSQPRDQTQVSHITGKFFTSGATREDSLTWGIYKQQQQITKLTDTENRSVVVRGRGWRVEELGEGGQKVQTSSYKIIKSQGCNVQHADYS